MDPELARRNTRLGWLLFGVFVLLFAGTIGIAFLYLHFGHPAHLPVPLHH